MTSSRPRDVGGSFASRRGHANQLSISDPSHHVTEAIGTLYESDGNDDSDSDTAASEKRRPLSFVSSAYGGDQMGSDQPDADQQDDQRLPLQRSTSDNSQLITPNGSPPSIKKSQTLPARMSPQRTASSHDNRPLSPASPNSPTLSLRDLKPAESSISLTNIDNPGDIAQELSNLQALRRMSMDVGNNSDPDLLPFQGIIPIPSIAPTGDDDESDPSRLLWVPANVHPELAPEQFKNFLERRVNAMKRRSGESSLSTDGLQRNNSASSLRRKKSMLSRQIDNSGGRAADGYMDGADRLERQKSINGHSTPELSLQELVQDPSKAVQKLAQEAHVAPDDNGPEDMPILPMAPGMGLRRSTRTQYRKGGSLRGDRVPFSKRLAERRAERDSGEAVPPVPKVDATTTTTTSTPETGLHRVNSEPSAVSSSAAENYSRPTRSVKRQQNFIRETQPESPVEQQQQQQSQGPQDDHSPPPSAPSQQQQQQQPAQLSKTSSVSTASPPVETPANNEQQPDQGRLYPERSSSQTARDQIMSQQQPQKPAQQQQTPHQQQERVQQQQQQQQQFPPRLAKRPGRAAQAPTVPLDNVEPGPTQTMNDIVNRSSTISGASDTRTDSLTFIPTISDAEKKRSRESDSEPSKPSKSSWPWFKSEGKKKKEREKEEEREREREREREEQARRAKSKSGEKQHENARLDVIQSSIDNVVSKGRESLLLDRDSIDSKLQEERKKETSRKSADGGGGGGKKEKDGFFGSFFGGGKRRNNNGDKDSSRHGNKRDRDRAASPDPPPAPQRPLRPDVDYPYTRFPLLEERAIYRMAHIKLANPKRDLLSQVLLSNFMYSYLAKIQAMHPQLQVPVSPQQKRAEEERRRREAEEEMAAAAAQQAGQAPPSNGGGGVESYNFEYHRSGNQYGDSGADYVDENELYDYEQGGGGDGDGPETGYLGQDPYGRSRQQPYYDYDHQNGGRESLSRKEEDDMW